MSDKTNRTRNSFLNAIFAIILTLVNGILGIVVTRLVISEYGSDFNGLNSTANQIINVLLILEGGFTLASNVALFSPLNKADYDTANSVLKATRYKFKKISILFLFIGLFVAGIYSIIVKTNLEREFVFTVITMAVVPQAFNLYFTTTYRVLLQTQQKEYIISGFTALTIGLGHLANIVMILLGGEMWMVRFITMSFAIVNCLLITGYTRKKNTFINFSKKARPDLIKGTNEVMAQKITGVIYTSWPIVFLSISSNGGTTLASVYAVYNSVFVMIKSLLHGIIDAPRLGFGQMLTERKKDEIWPIFRQYEFIGVFFTFVTLITACGLILPFISLYTNDIDDANYYDIKIAVLMVLIATIEMIHIPSGHMINMSGNFRISKIFQILACVTLMIMMSVLGSIFGVYGMLIALLLVAILLALLEIGFVHIKFFENKLLEVIKLMLPFAVVGAFCAAVEMKFAMNMITIPKFLAMGFIFTMINCLLGMVIGFIFNPEDTKALFSRGAQLVHKKTGGN